MQIRKKIYWTAFVLPLLCCCAPKPKARPSPVLQLRSLGQLATTEFELAKVVRARDEDTWYKLGERRMLITCSAKIRAGIDLSQIRDIDVEHSKSKITIKLPPPQIISFSMPPENIKVAFMDVGLFRDQFSQAETNAILQQAEVQIRRQADSLNILQKAQEGAVSFITSFFEQAGYEQVSVSVRYRENNEPDE